MKKRKKTESLSPFDLFRQSLSEGERAALCAFFNEFDTHCLLPRSEKERLKTDFESALLRYKELNVDLQTAVERLDIANLGGFYSRPPILWYALDDAAKIYPLSMRRGQMAVFRLSVYFYEDVVPELLQMALTFTMKRFPSFATTVKRGFFWHYLDTSKRRFAIEPDSGLPCRALKIARSGSQSFRVMYYKNRVSVEFFHILTDGVGGMIFLKTLAAEYLRLCGYPASPAEGVLDVGGQPTPEEAENGFKFSERTYKASGFVDRPALQMSGKLSRSKPYRVLHFKMDAERLKSAAKGMNATVTAYVLAQIFLAGRFATDELNGDMNIQVPVNMRKFYPSQTLRNFSLYCGVRLPVQDITSAAEIVPEIARQLSQKATKDAMSEMMKGAQGLVNAVRYVPLFIKAPIARLVYGFLGDKIFSTTLSNLGVVNMPEELAGHIESMDFTLGTALSNRASCSMVTYGNIATLSIAKMTADPSFEERLFELLAKDGVEAEVEGSAPDES
ncbi:MAG: hypothetical protein Q4C04_04935 [Clostridia bacterium]|nr:hypothetical protein [Clostridia bacterium]